MVGWQKVLLGWLVVSTFLLAGLEGDRRTGAPGAELCSSSLLRRAAPWLASFINSRQSDDQRVVP